MVAQKLGAIAAPAEVLSSVSSTHVVSVPPVPGYPMFSSDFCGHCSYMHVHPHPPHTHTIHIDMI